MSSSDPALELGVDIAGIRILELIAVARTPGDGGGGGLGMRG